MPYIQYLLIADKYIVEEGTKKRSLIGTFDFLTTDKLPTKIQPFVIFFRLQQASEAKSVLLKIKSPDGSVLTEITLPREGDETELNVNIDVSGLELSAYGEYPIEIYVNNKILEPAPKQNISLIK